MLLRDVYGDKAFASVGCVDVNDSEKYSCGMYMTTKYTLLWNVDANSCEEYSCRVYMTTEYTPLRILQAGIGARRAHEECIR